MRYRYYIADVFTDQIFGGNPLAVFPAADGLEPQQMQRIARELNLSETVFVTKPEDEQHSRRLRIFTPSTELPFAGHPTLGSAHVLASIGEIPLSSEESEVIFEEKIGPIAVKIRTKNGRPVFAQLSAAKMPEIAMEIPSLRSIASALSLDISDLLLGDDRPMAVSCGVPFLIVPLRSLEALGRVRLDRETWEGTIQESWAPSIYAFAYKTESEDADLRARMFAPGMGIEEDPATGAAAAALAGYLTAQGKRSAGLSSWTIEQGIEIGRPSLLHVEADLEDGEAVAIRIGGTSVLVGQAEIEVPAPGKKGQFLPSAAAETAPPGPREVARAVAKQGQIELEETAKDKTVQEGSTDKTDGQPVEKVDVISQKGTAEEDQDALAKESSSEAPGKAKEAPEPEAAGAGAGKNEKVVSLKSVLRSLTPQKPNAQKAESPDSSEEAKLPDSKSPSPEKGGDVKESAAAISRRILSESKSAAEVDGAGRLAAALDLKSGLAKQNAMKSEPSVSEKASEPAAERSGSKAETISAKEDSKAPKSKLSHIEMPDEAEAQAEAMGFDGSEEDEGLDDEAREGRTFEEESIEDEIRKDGEFLNGSFIDEDLADEDLADEDLADEDLADEEPDDEDLEDDGLEDDGLEDDDELDWASQKKQAHYKFLWSAILRHREQIYACVIIDLSPKAALLQIEEELAYDLTLNFDSPITLKNEKIGQLKGEVVWREKNRLGVQLIEDPEDVARIIDAARK